MESPSSRKAPEGSEGRIPVTVLTGFLGSGKTTLLNQLVGLAGMDGIAVLINEFGTVGIDHLLVEAIDDTMVLLDSGCICCTVRGGLVQALEGLHTRSCRREIPALRHVIIETTGLADPVPIVALLMEDRFVAARFSCDGVVTTCDATHIESQLSKHPEAVRQVAAADLLLLTKTDLLESRHQARVAEVLRRVNLDAQLHTPVLGRLAPDVFFARGAYTAAALAERLPRWLPADAHLPSARAVRPDEPVEGRSTAGYRPATARTPHIGARLPAQSSEPATEGASAVPHSHLDRVSSFTVTIHAAVDWLGFSLVMGQILARNGGALLRVKGILPVRGESRPVVVHCVQDVAYPVVKLRDWPEHAAFSRTQGQIVFISEGLGALDRQVIETSLQQLPGPAEAARQLRRHTLLPTRCWLRERFQVMPPGSFETDAWMVAPRRFLAASQSGATDSSS